MLRKSSSREATNHAYFSSKEMGDYLQNLRSNKIQRPTGSRPPPSNFNRRTWTAPQPTAMPTATAVAANPTEPQATKPVAAQDTVNRQHAGRPIARLPTAPITTVEKSDLDQLGVNPDNFFHSNIPYIERGARWMERQEAKSIRQAMRDMDVKDVEREQEVHAAAQDEATQLVWEHQQQKNAPPEKDPEAAAHRPYQNPDVPATANKYRAHLRKGSHAKSHSVDHQYDLDVRRASGLPPRSESSMSTRSETVRSRLSMIFDKGHETITRSKSPSGTVKSRSPHSSASNSQASSRVPSGSSTKSKASSGSVPSAEDAKDTTEAIRPKKSYSSLANAVEASIQRIRRTPSGNTKRTPSGNSLLKTPFTNPEDRIYEDPVEDPHLPSLIEAAKETPTPTPPRPSLPNNVTLAGTSRAEMPASIRRNPFARVRFAQEQAQLQQRSNTDPTPLQKPHNRFEIHRNPPSQSRNPGYTTNNSPTPPSPEKDADQAIIVAEPAKDAMQEKERRSDDIRAATSKSRSDRSEKLPMPSAVSDRPGRPIVSFDREWKPQQPKVEVEAAANTMARQTMSPPPLIQISETASEPRKTASAPITPVPSISISPDTSAEHRSPFISPRTTFKPPRDTTGPLLKEQRAQTMPIIPTICLPDDEEEDNQAPAPGIPTIIFPGDDEKPEPKSLAGVPSINISPSNPPSTTRALPNPAPQQSRQRAHPRIPPPQPHTHQGSRATTTTTTRTRSSPFRQTTALCSACALPISGDILLADNSRYHPRCFTCHDCFTSLECVQYHREPPASQGKRAQRIAKRHAQFPLTEDEDGEKEWHGTPEVREWSWSIIIPSEESDGVALPDGSVEARHYCHLCFHERFSPRCRNCKTPIEGEVILACGAEWHAGHFFCAECGDPFDSSTPFVERGGYAWCVNCDMKRTAPRCGRCRKGVQGVVLEALGRKWCEGCFVCVECTNSFSEGKFFVREDSATGGMDPVCEACEARRLKSFGGL